jgi:hypothetical protein
MAILGGGVKQWKIADYLNTDMANSLRWLVWAKTKDAQKGRNKPQMIKTPEQSRKPKTKTTAAQPDQVKKLLAMPRKEK